VKTAIICCTAGWVCEKTITDNLQVYEHEETVEEIRGDYSALLADSLTRYCGGEPILFFAWKPHCSASILREGKEVE